MILDYYGLSEQPFGVTPDSRFLYLGQKHREALASLLYGTEANRGFLALIAQPGMGKTTLLYHYLDYLRDKARTAFVFRTDCDSREFMRHLLLDLGIDVAGMDLPAMHDALNRILLDEMNAGRKFVLVIDEGQNLEEKVLESIRLLSNFETPWTKLMQIVLAGQPQLADRLASSSMAQLRQRVSMVVRIEPLTHAEVNAYIDHRLWVAGCTNASVFTVGARKLIAEYSEGIPRNINNLCFNAMSLACALERQNIDRDVVQDVIRDLDLEPLRQRRLSGDRGEKTPARSTAISSSPIEFSSLYTSWFARLAAMALLLLAIGWFVVRAGVVKWPMNQQPVAAMTHAAAVTEAPAVTQPVSKPSPLRETTPAEPVVREVNLGTDAPAETETTRADTPRESVKVKQGQTLYQISLQRLGKYNSSVLEKLRTVNPWLNDPNHIITGQTIQIPGQTTTSSGERQTAELAANASVTKAGKQ